MSGEPEFALLDQVYQAKLTATSAFVVERAHGDSRMVQRQVTPEERQDALRFLREHAPEEYERIKKARGFAALSADKQKRIASQGGKAAHASGAAHRFTSEEARKAGAIGGAKNPKEHLQAIGSKGGRMRAAAYHQRFETVIEFGGHTSTQLCAGCDPVVLTVRDRHIVDVAGTSGTALEGVPILGHLLWNRPQVGRRLRLLPPQSGASPAEQYFLPWLIAKIERREVSALR